MISARNDYRMIPAIPWLKGRSPTGPQFAPFFARPVDVGVGVDVCVAAFQCQETPCRVAVLKFCRCETISLLYWWLLNKEVAACGQHMWGTCFIYWLVKSQIDGRALSKLDSLGKGSFDILVKDWFSWWTSCRKMFLFSLWDMRGSEWAFTFKPPDYLTPNWQSHNLIFASYSSTMHFFGAVFYICFLFIFFL